MGKEVSGSFVIKPPTQVKTGELITKVLVRSVVATGKGVISELFETGTVFFDEVVAHRGMTSSLRSSGARKVSRCACIYASSVLVWDHR